MTIAYLKEKVGFYDVDLEYLFPVNQTNCFGFPIADMLPGVYDDEEEP